MRYRSCAATPPSRTSAVAVKFLSCNTPRQHATTCSATGHRPCLVHFPTTSQRRHNRISRETRCSSNCCGGLWSCRHAFFLKPVPWERMPSPLFALAPPSTTSSAGNTPRSAVSRDDNLKMSSLQLFFPFDRIHLLCEKRAHVPQGMRFVAHHDCGSMLEDFHGLPRRTQKQCKGGLHRPSKSCCHPRPAIDLSTRAMGGSYACHRVSVHNVMMADHFTCK